MASGQRADRAKEAVVELVQAIGFRKLADIGLVALHVLLGRAAVALEDVLAVLEVVAHGWVALRKVIAAS